MCGGELIIYYKLVQVMQLVHHDVLAIAYPQFRALMPSDARVFPAMVHSWVPLQLCPSPNGATLPKIRPLPSGSPHPATHGCWDAKAWLPYFNSRHLWNVIQVSEFSKRSAEDSVASVSQFTFSFSQSCPHSFIGVAPEIPSPHPQSPLALKSPSQNLSPGDHNLQPGLKSRLWRGSRWKSMKIKVQAQAQDTFSQSY